MDAAKRIHAACQKTAVGFEGQGWLPTTAVQWERAAVAAKRTRADGYQAVAEMANRGRASGTCPQ